MELQLSGGCLYLVHCHGLPLEELVRHSRVLHQEKGGEEEEAQEGKADNLSPLFSNFSKKSECSVLQSTDLFFPILYLIWK